MPAKPMPISENLLLLKKIQQQNEYIIATINKINDNQSKLELLHLASVSKLDLLNQKVNKIQSETDMSKKGWIF